jgi:hypothetical protein
MLSGGRGSAPLVAAADGSTTGPNDVMDTTTSAMGRGAEPSRVGACPGLAELVTGQASSAAAPAVATTIPM